MHELKGWVALYPEPSARDRYGETLGEVKARREADVMMVLEQNSGDLGRAIGAAISGDQAGARPVRFKADDQGTAFSVSLAPIGADGGLDACADAKRSIDDPDVAAPVRPAAEPTAMPDELVRRIGRAIEVWLMDRASAHGLWSPQVTIAPAHDGVPVARSDAPVAAAADGACTPHGAASGAAQDVAHKAADETTGDRAPGRTSIAPAAAAVGSASAVSGSVVSGSQVSGDRASGTRRLWPYLVFAAAAAALVAAFAILSVGD